MLLVGEMQFITPTMEGNIEIPQKSKDRAAI
jgi:hypothetical protein